MPAEVLYATAFQSGSVAGGSNATGAPDGTFTTDTGDVGWTGTWLLEAGAGNLDGLQTLTVLTRYSGATAGATLDVTVTHPTLGTVASAVAVSIDSATGQNVQVQWTGSDTSTGLTVTLTAVASGGKPADRSSVQVDAFTWDANTITPSVPASGTVAAISGASGDVSVILPSAPAAPTNLVVVDARSTEVDLTWLDNSDDETGFRIEFGVVGATANIVQTKSADDLTTVTLDTAPTPGNLLVVAASATNSSATTWAFSHGLTLDADTTKVSVYAGMASGIVQAGASADVVITPLSDPGTDWSMTVWEIEGATGLVDVQTTAPGLGEVLGPVTISEGAIALMNYAARSEVFDLVITNMNIDHQYLGSAEAHAIAPTQPLSVTATWTPGRGSCAILAGYSQPAPLALDSLVAWYDLSDTASIIDSGGVVSQINDKSGNGFHLDTVVGSPLIGTRSINSLNVLDFDGASRIYTEASLGLEKPSPLTMFTVFASDATPSPTRPATVGLATGSRVQFSPTSETAVRVSNGYVGWTAEMGVGVHGVLTTGMPADALVEDIWGRLNGIDLVLESSSSGLATMNLGAGCSLGALSSGNLPFDGVVAEVIICNADLTGTSDQTDIEQYLMDKWGL